MNDQLRKKFTWTFKETKMNSYKSLVFNVQHWIIYNDNKVVWLLI